MIQNIFMFGSASAPRNSPATNNNPQTRDSMREMPGHFVVGVNERSEP